MGCFGSNVGMYQLTDPAGGAFGRLGAPLLRTGSILRINHGSESLVGSCVASAIRLQSHSVASSEGRTSESAAAEMSVEARQVASENMDAAESAIDDADFVFDVAHITRGRVLAHRAAGTPTAKPGLPVCGLSLLR